MMSMDMSITLMDDSDRNPNLNPNHTSYYTNSSHAANTNGLQLGCSGGGAFASSDHNQLLNPNSNTAQGLVLVAADTAITRLGQQRHGQINRNAPCNNNTGSTPGMNYNHNGIINNANGSSGSCYNADINVHPSTLIHSCSNDGPNHHHSRSIFNRRVAPYQIVVHGKTANYNNTNPFNSTTSNSSSSDNNGDDGMNHINEVSELYLSPPPPPSSSLASPSSCSSFSSSSSSAGKYVRYSAEQIRILERLYEECPKPSSARREHLIRHNPPLHHVEPRQIKVWFQNRRCREKQRKETSRLQMVNSKLAMMNKLLMDENVRLQDQVSHLIHENAYLVIQQQQQQQQQLSLQHTSAITNITPHASCDSIVLNGNIQQFPAPQQQKQVSTIVPCDSTNYPGVALPEEALVEFNEKPIGPTTSDSWIQMPGILKVL